MRTHTRMLTVLAALVTASIFSSKSSAEETWVRFMSHDKKASALFPAQPDKIETLTRKSPAGTINTRRGQYEEEGALLSLAATKLPNAALRFAGTDKILRNAAEGVLGTYFAKKTSEKKTQIGGEPAIILEFRVPDYEKEDHPGYRGVAIALLVDGTLYVVTGIVTKEDPKSKAKVRKLLESIQVHK